jgi:hypothetical protein
VGPYHPDSAGRSDANPVSNFVSYCSPKDHNEFGIVRENVKKHLEAVCSKVEEEFHKRVIKQARVQHLYTRLVGQLKNKSSEVSFSEEFFAKGFYWLVWGLKIGLGFSSKLFLLSIMASSSSNSLHCPWLS